MSIKVCTCACVCLGHACNLKRRLFEEAAQRWKHGCSMVFQSLLATQPSILPWFAQQQVDASSAFIDIAWHCLLIWCAQTNMHDNLYVCVCVSVSVVKAPSLQHMMPLTAWMRECHESPARKQVVTADGESRWLPLWGGQMTAPPEV